MRAECRTTVRKRSIDDRAVGVINGVAAAGKSLRGFVRRAALRLSALAATDRRVVTPAQTSQPTTARSPRDRTIRPSAKPSRTRPVRRTFRLWAIEAEAMPDRREATVWHGADAARLVKMMVGL